MMTNGNLRKELKVFNTTQLLVALQGVSRYALSSAGIGNGGQCKADQAAPVPPEKEPDERGGGRGGGQDGAEQ